MEKYPTFKQLTDAVKTDDPMSGLLWMAIAKLSTEGHYTQMTPEEVYVAVVETARSVYA